MTDVKLLLLHTWNHLSICKKKMSLGSFKNDIGKMYLQIIHI